MAVRALRERVNSISVQSPKNLQRAVGFYRRVNSRIVSDEIYRQHGNPMTRDEVDLVWNTPSGQVE